MGGDISADLPSGDASVSIKSPDLDGEYKASADMKTDTPEGDINAVIPSADVSVNVKSPELDVKPIKPSGKSKSAGFSCFGKPKESDFDDDFKASADVKVN